MARRDIAGRVFVVGVPRSGTTLVQSLLAAHSAVTSFTESHFFDSHFSHLPMRSGPILTQNPVPRLHEFLVENGEAPPEAAAWFCARGRQLLWWRPLLPLWTIPAARQLLRVLDQLALQRGASSWVEKTPRHLRYIPFLENVSAAGPRQAFVHVIRNGLEVVASLHQASRSWERHYDVDTCVRRWNADVAFSCSRIGKPNDHFVLYEELTRRPEATLEQLLAGIGLGWEPQILERFGDASDRLITTEESWKADVGRSIRRSQTSHRALTAAQRERVNRWLRHRLYDQIAEGAGRASRDHGRAC